MRLQNFFLDSGDHLLQHGQSAWGSCTLASWPHAVHCGYTTGGGSVGLTQKPLQVDMASLMLIMLYAKYVSLGVAELASAHGGTISAVFMDVEDADGRDETGRNKGTLIGTGGGLATGGLTGGALGVSITTPVGALLGGRGAALKGDTLGKPSGYLIAWLSVTTVGKGRTTWKFAGFLNKGWIGTVGLTAAPLYACDTVYKLVGLIGEIGLPCACCAWKTECLVAPLLCA